MWKTIIIITGVLAIFAMLALALAGVTSLLPYSNEKYYVALTAVATLFLAVGTLIFMAYQTHVSERVAGLQMFIQLDTQYNSDSLRSARSQLAPLLIGDKAPVPALAENVLDFFEMLACYTREKHLNYKMVSNGFSLPIRCYWYVLKDYVFEMRKKHNDQSFYEHLEWLNSRLEKEYTRDQTDDLSHHTLTKEQVHHFLRSETNTIVPHV